MLEQQKTFTLVVFTYTSRELEILCNFPANDQLSLWGTREQEIKYSDSVSQEGSNIIKTFNWQDVTL